MRPILALLAVVIFSGCVMLPDGTIECGPCVLTKQTWDAPHAPALRKYAYAHEIDTGRVNWSAACGGWSLF